MGIFSNIQSGPETKAKSDHKHMCQSTDKTFNLRENLARASVTSGQINSNLCLPMMAQFLGYFPFSFQRGEKKQSRNMYNT